VIKAFGGLARYLEYGGKTVVEEICSKKGLDSGGDLIRQVMAGMICGRGILKQNHVKVKEESAGQLGGSGESGERPGGEG
jgi:hypothetical protein